MTSFLPNLSPSLYCVRSVTDFAEIPEANALKSNNVLPVQLFPAPVFPISNIRISLLSESEIFMKNYPLDLKKKEMCYVTKLKYHFRVVFFLFNSFGLNGTSHMFFFKFHQTNCHIYVV